MKIPRISDGVLASMAKNTENREWNQKKIEELKVENPNAFKLIVYAAETHGQHASAMAHLMYLLIESQLEAEEMNNEVLPGDAP